MSNLDARVAELAAKYLPLAAEMLAGGDPHPGRLRRPAARRRAAIRSAASPTTSSRGSSTSGRRSSRSGRCAARRTPPSTTSATSSGGSRIPNDGIAPGEEEGRLHRRPHRHRQGAAAQWQEKVGGVDCYDGLVDASKHQQGVPQEGAGLGPARVRVEAPPLRPRLGRPARRRGLGDDRHQDPRSSSRARARSRASIVRSYATVCEEDNDGAGPMYLDAQGLPDGRARGHPRRRHPHGRHRLLQARRARDLPRPARPHADRGDGHRQVLPRLDAVGRPEPARVRRRHRQGGGREVRQARGLPRRRVPRPRHPHRLLGPPRHAERLRRARALRLPLRPPAHHRRDPRAGRRRRREALRPSPRRARPA